MQGSGPIYLKNNTLHFRQDDGIRPDSMYSYDLYSYMEVSFRPSKGQPDRQAACKSHLLRPVATHSHVCCGVSRPCCLSCTACSSTSKRTNLQARLQATAIRGECTASGSKSSPRGALSSLPQTLGRSDPPMPGGVLETQHR